MPGSPPAPRPRVILSPMRILCGASDWSSAWASVLTAMNSTPINSARIMRLTALLPPPPTPMTRMSAKFSESDRSGIRTPPQSVESVSCQDGPARHGHRRASIGETSRWTEYASKHGIGSHLFARLWTACGQTPPATCGAALPVRTTPRTVSPRGTSAAPAGAGCRRWCRAARSTARCRAEAGRRPPAR